MTLGGGVNLRAIRVRDRWVGNLTRPQNGKIGRRFPEGPAKFVTKLQLHRTKQTRRIFMCTAKWKRIKDV